MRSAGRAKGIEATQGCLSTVFGGSGCLAQEGITNIKANLCVVRQVDYRNPKEYSLKNHLYQYFK